MSTALITGASGGIGQAFAEELAAQNINLVLVSRSEEKLNQLAQQLQAQYKIQVDAIVKDLTEPSATQVVYDTVQAKGLRIDLLINNAGFGDYGDFAERDGERQLKIIQLNIIALVDLTHKFLPEMRQRRSGGIINLSSLSGFQPIPYLSVYAASKAFILSFSQALWAENRDYGVRVLVVCPGPVDTNFFAEAQIPVALAGKTNKISTSKEVARASLKALERGDSTVVIGDFNTHAITKLSPLVPRKILLTMLEKQFRK
ncbi:SDR family oxidoreductase [Aetokthonos hydrillicola Thurmond2011]|uniref:SDR family oxidoreductase n=2 Tax=Aetokthonos TaxID=1550243 RepID=A0AAP5IAL0_9CYAN|nr:SDR family oxidoreductase [Aetokthonos hydrillicola]MBO3460705.1 SDR family oxidoreductase [Aetokthonos hydrillicola CCALA 1050]MBW4587702.1 SDR family oxidoreductase [Aetokthonos hydrillicola CCALA 1050]MDR9897916.1 SDR family oxidoreductase [Aetokthonos hydrillicola Thurmond2011]